MFEKHHDLSKMSNEFSERCGPGCRLYFPVARSVSHWETVWPDGGSFSIFFFLTPPFFFSLFQSLLFFFFFFVYSLQVFSKESWEGRTRCFGALALPEKSTRSDASSRAPSSVVNNQPLFFNKSVRSKKAVANVWTCKISLVRVWQRCYYFISRVLAAKEKMLCVGS